MDVILRETDRDLAVDRSIVLEQKAMTVDIVWDGGATWASGNVPYGPCLGTRPSRVGTAQRSHRLCDHLERPRRQRGKCRGELRAAVGRGVCWCTPLAREHDGDEHLEPLHTLRSKPRIDDARAA